MRNPLNKRYTRELKSDFGKYLVIFAFMVLFAGAMSGFFITGDSVMKLYQKNHTELNLEDGHIAFNYVPEESILKQIEEENHLKLYPLFYKEETLIVFDPVSGTNECI